MKHNCKLKDEEGYTYEQFFDAVIDGSFEYDDYFDAYLWFRPRFKRKRWWRPWERVSFCADILCYCPYCGEKLSEPIGEIEEK